MKKISRLKKYLFVLIALFPLSAAFIVTDGLYHRGKVQTADVGIVLGSMAYRNARPSPALKARLDEALELYQRKVFRHIIVSGGIDPDGTNEALVMRNYLVEQGVAPSQILVDQYGDNTRATAQNGAQIMASRGFKSAVMISQYYHLTRSRLAMEQAGVKEVFTSAPHYFERKDFFSIPRETVGIYFYLFGIR